MPPPQFLLSELPAAILIPHSPSSAWHHPQFLLSALPAAIRITHSQVLRASFINSCYQLCLPLSALPILKFCVLPSSIPAISSACRYPHYPFSSSHGFILKSSSPFCMP
jgi:hypothetical protein